MLNQEGFRPETCGWRQIFTVPIRDEIYKWADAKEDKRPKLHVRWDGHGEANVEAIGFELPEGICCVAVQRREKVIKKQIGTRIVQVPKKHKITGEILYYVEKEKKVYEKQKVGGGRSIVHLVISADRKLLLDEQIRRQAKTLVSWLHSQDPTNFKLLVRGVYTVDQAVEKGPLNPPPKPVKTEPEPEKDMQSWRLDGIPEDKRHRNLGDALRASKRHHEIQKIRVAGRKERGKRPLPETAARAHHSRGRRLDEYIDLIGRQGFDLTEQELQVLVDSGAFGQWKEAQKNGWTQVKKIRIVNTFEGQQIAIQKDDGTFELVPFEPDPEDDEPSGKKRRQNLPQLKPSDDCPV